MCLVADLLSALRCKANPKQLALSRKTFALLVHGDERQPQKFGRQEGIFLTARGETDIEQLHTEW